MADIRRERRLREDETWAEKLLWRRDAEADKLVYALHGLTPKEKALVQAAAK